jgi:hypothetical protein
MVSTGQGPSPTAAYLLAGRAAAGAALLVAGVPLAVARLLALKLAGEGLGALHLLLASAAPALLHLHLQAGRAGAAVATLRAVGCKSISFEHFWKLHLVSPGVGSAAEQLATRVSACGCGLRAGEPHHGLAAGALAVQGERTGRAGTRRVADQVAADSQPSGTIAVQPTLTRSGSRRQAVRRRGGRT